MRSRQRNELANLTFLLCVSQCDLRNESEIEKMFEWIGAEPDLGRVDVCVANAGLSSPESLLDGEHKSTARNIESSRSFCRRRMI